MATINLPDASVPVIDPQTGLMTPVWYDVLKRMISKLNTL